MPNFRSRVLDRLALAFIKETVGDRLEAALAGAGSCRVQGRHAEAAGHTAWELAACERERGPDDPALAPLLERFGFLLYVLREDGRAEDCFRRALALRAGASGTDGPETAVPLNALAAVCFGQGKGALALKYFWRADALFRQAERAARRRTRWTANKSV